MLLVALSLQHKQFVAQFPAGPQWARHVADAHKTTTCCLLDDECMYVYVRMMSVRVRGYIQGDQCSKEGGSKG